MGVILSEDLLKVRRGAELEITDRAELYEILDAGKVMHIGIADESGYPVVIPLAYVRDSDRILIHGSTGSRLFRRLAAGAKLCGTVTILDGIVLARSAFHHAMNYRSVMVFGSAKVIPVEEKSAALQLFTNQSVPDRWQEVRPMSTKEAAATLVLGINLDRISGKVRTGGPRGEDAEDQVLPIWAGEIPIITSYGEPIDAADLPAGTPKPESIRNLK